MYGPMASSLSGGRTYIRGGLGDEELFDLADRDESRNLAGSPAERPALERGRELLAPIKRLTPPRP